MINMRNYQDGESDECNRSTTVMVILGWVIGICALFCVGGYVAAKFGRQIANIAQLVVVFFTIYVICRQDKVRKELLMYRALYLEKHGKAGSPEARKALK